MSHRLSLVWSVQASNQMQGDTPCLPVSLPVYNALGARLLLIDDKELTPRLCEESGLDPISAFPDLGTRMLAPRDF